MHGVELEWKFEQRAFSGQLEYAYTVFATATDTQGFRQISVFGEDGTPASGDKALDACLMLADLVELEDPNQAMKLRNGAALEFTR